MNKIPLILDVDTGVDDAIAILYALSCPELELLGICTVAGNQTLDKTTRNTLSVLEYLGRTDVPVAMGSSGPLMRPLHTAPQVHGENGLGNVQPAPSRPKSPSRRMRSAVCAAGSSRAPAPVTIAAVGPLTNIALLLKSYPHLKSKIEKIAIMGAARSAATPARLPSSTSMWIPRRRIWSSRRGSRW